MNRLWSTAEDRKLRELYPTTPAAKIAEQLGRKVSAIYKRCWALGLRHTLDASKGHIIKGRMGERLAQNSSFKPGNRPHNWVPVGTVVTAHIGYLSIKIAEPKHWCLLHHFNWMEVHGPIPPGHALKFIDGDRTNCAVNNLRLITKGQVMTDNAIHRMHAELQSLSRLKGLINKRINQLEKTKEATHG